MRILLVADAESPHTRRWASALADEGHDVLLAGFGGPRLAGVEQVRLGHGHGRSRYLRAVPKLRRVIAGFAPQVVNAHFVSSYGVMANLTGSGVPLLLTAWGSDVLWLPFRPGWHRDLTTSALVNASLITYDSEDVGSLLCAYAPRTPRRRVVFGPERAWARARRHEQPIVLSGRRPEWFYNVESVLDAFAMTRAGFPEWRLDVLTYGLDVSHLHARAAALDVGEAVRFVGLLDRAGIEEHYLRAAIFCSVPSSDGSAASLLEGMAAGSFPIVSDLPANHEWIEHPKNGLVVPAGDTGALADALKLAMSSPELRAEACVRNRHYVAQSASWETAIHDVVDALTGLTASMRAST